MSNSTSHLLVTAVDEEELIKALKPTEEKKGKSYQATMERNPWLAQEATILQAQEFALQHCPSPNRYPIYFQA